jgi:hypothetical protein
MPPIGLWGSSNGVYPGTGVTFPVPTTARPLDVLLVVLVVPTGSALVLPAGWASMASDDAGAPVNETVHLLRHVVADGDPAQVVFTVSAALSPQPLGLMLAYRSLDASRGVLDRDVEPISPASTTFAIGTVFSSFSDLWLLIFYAKDPAGTATFTLPAGIVPRGAALQVLGGSGGGALAVAEFLQAPSGQTGAKTATCSSSQTGIAVGYLLAATATPQAQVLVPDIAGAIGLPQVGV